MGILSPKIIASCIDLTRAELAVHVRNQGGTDDEVGIARREIAQIRAIREHRRRTKPAQPIELCWRLEAFKRNNAERKARKIYLDAPIAALWSKPLRLEVEHSYDFKVASVRATIEALARDARKRGYSLRHSSNSKGRANSRYLIRGSREVRISDHDIPVYGERAERYERTGGPQWYEIIVTPNLIASLDLQAWRTLVDGEDAQSRN